MKDEKPPLRKYLVKEIEREGYLSLDAITGIALSLGHKQDTARRILNKDMSSNIEPVYNDKHQIKGYRFNADCAKIGVGEKEISIRTEERSGQVALPLHTGQVFGF